MDANFCFLFSFFFFFIFFYFVQRSTHRHQQVCFGLTGFDLYAKVFLKAFSRQSQVQQLLLKTVGPEIASLRSFEADLLIKVETGQTNTNLLVSVGAFPEVFSQRDAFQFILLLLL